MCRNLEADPNNKNIIADPYSNGFIMSCFFLWRVGIRNISKHAHIKVTKKSPCNQDFQACNEVFVDS